MSARRERSTGSLSIRVESVMVHVLSNIWATIWASQFFTSLITSFIARYGKVNVTSAISWHSIISPAVIASRAASRYATISPEVPNFIPPKYLTTHITIFVRLNEFICPNIGFPAVPDGSPLSLLINVSRCVPIIYAQHTWRASKYSFGIALSQPLPPPRYIQGAQMQGIYSFSPCKSLPPAT